MTNLVVVQSPSHVWLFVTPWTAACQASLSLTISQSFPKFFFIALGIPSSPLILWHPLLLPSTFPSIRDFSSESSVHIKQPKYWIFSFSISTSSEYSGLISLKIDWFDLAVQGTLRNILQHHSLKALILKHSLWSSSHYNMWPRKTVALAIWTFVGRVMSLLFNALSRLVIAFLPRSKRLLNSWPLSSSTVILEGK